MSEAIVLNVIVGYINSTDSYCSLEGYSDFPTRWYHSFISYFKDAKGNLVNIKSFLALEEYDFCCQILVSPSKIIYSSVIEYKTNHYDCTFQLNEPCIYVFAEY